MPQVARPLCTVKIDGLAFGMVALQHKTLILRVGPASCTAQNGWPTATPWPTWAIWANPKVVCGWQVPWATSPVCHQMLDDTDPTAPVKGVRIDEVWIVEIHPSNDFQCIPLFLWSGTQHHITTNHTNSHQT
eukprot:TRINITY_DN67827_c7_g4_i3.p1 TRINITY_DN67827_c7_g4~~TRINITY_DN67827_c7_g4_i3.p1  ORF type:complete len:132 (+),score=1.65 TRINITY_DN67827_c7_g4_i3:1452-1847(+)